MQDLKTATERVFREHAAGNFDVAEAMYDQILAQLKEPDFNILNGYGGLLVARGRYGLGVSLLQTALTIYDKHPGLWTNLGVAYKYLGYDELAIEAYDRAYQLDPNAVEVLASLAGYYINRDEPKKVESYARKALKRGDHPSAHVHLAMGLLEQGRFKEAWPHYEHRWDTLDRIKNKRTYASPKWDGRPVQKLVIHGEQGLGDEILFMSLFSKAKERAEEIVIECADRLIPIFSDAFRVRCYASERDLKEAESPEDAHIAMGSLPLVLGLPDGKPFLPRPNAVRVGPPIIGIAWKGGTQKTNKDFRTLKIEQLKPIFESCDAQFISVQYGDDSVDADASRFAIATGPRDLRSLHYRIGICDLVITVCQTAVHQAGAMGIPCWVLTPRKCAWRYRGNPSDPTSMLPWYSSVELFRQHGDDEWDGVIGTIAKRLRERYGELAA